MKLKILVLITLFFGQFLFAQSADEIAIGKALNNYINGGSFNNPEQIKSAFTEDATLYLTKGDGSSMTFTPQTYADLFKKRPQGQFSGRIGNIISTEVYNDVATAKAEIIIPKANLSFIDLFLLKKINNEWKIVSKTATRQTLESNGRVLFVVSNAKTYGDSSIETGTSFSEIVHAYNTFLEHNYYVDFVSPNGGAIHLGRYYNPKDSLQKAYYNNKEFMTRLKNTKSPEFVNAQSYKAVYYVGGGSAMYQVPNNKAIQKITMSVYEEGEGVVSAVCHGTAGIVNLKTKDGAYLIKGKKVNGFPDAFEKKEKAYYKEFPFSIEKKVNQQGGHFTYSANGWDNYAIADDRLITGQDPSASAKVAELVIAKLKEQ